MKQLTRLFLLAAIVIVAACDEKKPVIEQPQGTPTDSLERVIEQKENEINDLMATFNEIQDAFRQINEAEKRVTISTAGENANQKQQIMENIEFISNTMARNRELINKLRGQLRESSLKGDELQKTLDNLMTQLDDKEKQLKELRAELDAKNIHIAQLDETISTLSTDVQDLKQESTQKSETISSQDKELHTAWFVYGTKSELKEQGILSDGKVLQGQFNKNYFTKIDIRVQKEIKLYSRSAKLLTAHPASAYTLQQNADKQYVLRITNPEQFWSASKYLVVQVK